MEKKTLGSVLSALRGTKGNRPLRRELIVTGIRNLATDAVGILTIGFSLSYGWYQEESGEWLSYQFWNEGVLTSGIFISLLIILAAEFTRHFLRHR